MNDNIQPMTFVRTKTNCIHGHLLSGDNLIFRSGKRQCRECTNRRSREATIRKKTGTKPVGHILLTHCKRGHEFNDKNTRILNGRRYCRLCFQIRKKHYRKTNVEETKEEDRKSTLRQKYGISIEDYQMMELAQGGVCAICKSYPGRRRLDVDHSHETLAIRGLLCERCNKAIGLLRDDPKICLAAAAYLTPSIIKEGPS